MSGIEAIYRDGVFKPLGDVKVPENQRVRLHVDLLDGTAVPGWLDDVRQLHRSILTRGTLPDSAPDIAADRTRDV